MAMRLLIPAGGLVSVWSALVEDIDDVAMLQSKNLRQRQNSDWVVNSADHGCEQNSNGISRYNHIEGVADLQACKEACENDAQCVSIDFFSDSNWCNLFRAACFQGYTTHDSPENWVYEPHTNSYAATGYAPLFPGHCAKRSSSGDAGEDVHENKVDGITTPADCAAHCDADPDCAGFEYYKYQNWDGGKCFSVSSSRNSLGDRAAGQFTLVGGGVWLDAQCYAKNTAWTAPTTTTETTTQGNHNGGGNSGDVVECSNCLSSVVDNMMNAMSNPSMLSNPSAMCSLLDPVGDCFNNHGCCNIDGFADQITASFSTLSAFGCSPPSCR